MIPLFCFFPSLAAKQKKKETAKAVSLRPSKKWQSHFFDYFLSPAKCSFVTLMTTGLSSSSAMRFGMDMRP